MKKIMMMMLIMGLSLVMVSCENDSTSSEPNPHDDIFGDVFVKKVSSPAGDKYGVVFYAGGQGLISCKATAPDGTEYDLVDFWKGPGNMRFHPAASDMMGEMTEAGDYLFTFSFSDGETRTITDQLSVVEIPSLKNTTVSHVTGTEEVATSWDLVSGTDNYIVKLTDKYKNETKPLFTQINLTGSDNAYIFDKNTSANPGWMQSGVPVAGDTCYVMITAVKYEDGVVGSVKAQNKQITTTTAKMIIW